MQVATYKQNKIVIKFFGSLWGDFILIFTHTETMVKTVSMKTSIIQYTEINQ